MFELVDVLCAILHGSTSSSSLPILFNSNSLLLLGVVETFCMLLWAHFSCDSNSHFGEALVNIVAWLLNLFSFILGGAFFSMIRDLVDLENIGEHLILWDCIFDIQSLMCGENPSMER